MAYLNGVHFENDIQMRGKRGDICIEAGFELELLCARHCPPNGIYWLAVNWRTAQQTKEFGANWSWALVRLTGGVGPLRTLHYAFGGRMDITWYDFSEAQWVGPIEMPVAPQYQPLTYANRR